MEKIVNYNGFCILYTGDEERVELRKKHLKKVMFYDNLEEIAKAIAERYTHGAHVLLQTTTRKDYYFRDNSFAQVDRMLNCDWSQKVTAVTFVSPSVKGLEKNVKGFGLPFDESQVIKPD